MKGFKAFSTSERNQVTGHYSARFDNVARSRNVQLTVWTIQEDKQLSAFHLLRIVLLTILSKIFLLGVQRNASSIYRTNNGTKPVNARRLRFIWWTVNKHCLFNNFIVSFHSAAKKCLSWWGLPIVCGRKVSMSFKNSLINPLNKIVLQWMNGWESIRTKAVHSPSRSISNVQTGATVHLISVCNQ